MRAYQQRFLRRKHCEQVDCDLKKGVFTKAVKVPPLGFAALPGGSMASSGDKVVIEPLDVDNYDTWCVRMKLFLIHKKMWNVVVDSSATAEQSQGALALIGLHVKDHHLGKVAAAKTAKELWDDLETTYKSKSNARKMLLRREINTLKLGSGEPISMSVARAEDLYKNVTAAGSDMKPEEVAFAILAGLPDEYGTLVTILEATSKKMSGKEMLPLLLQTEARFETPGELREG
jgi:hypothetical protein